MLWQDTVKECTFQPVTTWRSLTRATASADISTNADLDKTSVTSEAALRRCARLAGCAARNKYAISGLSSVSMLNSLCTYGAGKWGPSFLAQLSD